MLTVRWDSAGSTGLPHQLNAGSLERYISGSGHRIICNYWDHQGERLLEIAIIINHLHRGEDICIFLDRMHHHQLNGKMFPCFLVRSTTRLL